MGVVWRAYDTLLRRDVAIKKVYLPAGLSDTERDELRTRAIREARAAGKLKHPGIAAVYDVFFVDDSPWIVMEWVKGHSLWHEVETTGPLRPARAASIGVQVLDALAVAHARGILHRDVKPQNILLTSGDRAVLIDFGIAAIADSNTRLTQSGAVIGTPGYIAPERVRGQQPGPASDLWSLGATLYYAVEGRHAYEAGNAFAINEAVRSRDPAPPRKAGPLRGVIQQLLISDASYRVSANVARKHLIAAQAGSQPTTTTAVSEPAKPDPKPRAKPHPTVTTSLIFALPLIGIGFAYVVASYLILGTGTIYFQDSGFFSTHERSIAALSLAPRPSNTLFAVFAAVVILIAILRIPEESYMSPTAVVFTFIETCVLHAFTALVFIVVSIGYNVLAEPELIYRLEDVPLVLLASFIVPWLVGLFLRWALDRRA